MSNENKIRILYVQPGKYPEERFVANKLHPLQQLVGGYMQAVYPWSKDKVALVCNDSGKVDGLPLNRCIEDYQEQLERVKPNTVIHYHAVIHRALKYAVKTDLIDVNPADKVDRPKKNEFTGNFYSKDEMNALFDAVRGSKIEVAVMLTAFYGLRRSEVVGLKWAAVDFEQNTIEICHTVTTVRLDGKEVLVESNGTKTKSSKRTLPLVPVFRERLLALQEEQKENRKLCGRCYNKKYADYICVDAMGNLLKPDYLSNSFQIILQNYHLRRIRFHDLRHSCASLLLANGVPMKMIQEWLGHSDFSTTANIYSHLDYASKVSSAEAMLNGLGMGSNPGNDT